MNTPEHITRIIERLDPVDRDALEQHLKDKSIMGDLMCLADIRAAIGDPHGKLMQDEVVNAISSLVKERDELAARVHEIAGCFQELIDNSTGVAGLHLNGDIAPWGELTEGGRFEGWLLPLSKTPDISLADVRAQAVLHFANSVQRDSIHGATLRALAKHHAEKLRKEAQ